MMTKVRFPTLEEIRSRAYQIHLARFSGHGHDLDDWLQAEYEMMQLPLHKIAELEAKAIEGNNLKLFGLARIALPLQKRPIRQHDDYKNHPPFRVQPVAGSYSRLEEGDGKTG